MQSTPQGKDPGRRPLWATIGVLAFLVVALSVALIRREMSRPEPPTAPPESAGTERPPAEPRAVDTTPIVIARQDGESCEADDLVHDMTVTAVGERTATKSTQQPVYLQDWQRMVRKYYPDLDGVPDADKPRLSKLLVPGQRLKVRYVTCGNGGIRFLTLLQPAG